MDKIEYIPRPVSDADYNKIKLNATVIRNQYTRESLANDLAVKDFDKMAQTIHDFSVSNSYANIQENSVPTK